jgi:histone acetyltransferase (RNA polymerase elongator complex component)
VAKDLVHQAHKVLRHCQRLRDQGVKLRYQMWPELT